MACGQSGKYTTLHWRSMPARLPIGENAFGRFTAWTVRLTLKTEGENGDGSNE